MPTDGMSLEQVRSLLHQLPHHERLVLESALDRQCALVEYRKTLVSWLEAHAWEWFATLTMRDSRSLPLARARFNRWRNAIGRKAWGRNYFKRHNEGIWGFAVWEPQTRGDWHAHLLVAGTNGVSARTAEQDWNRGVAAHERQENECRDIEEQPGPTRLAKVVPYRAGAGGAHYCVKQLGEEAEGRATFDTFGPWPTSATARPAR